MNRIRATTQFDSDGRAIKAVGVNLDINDEKQNLLKMTQRDPLTGIYNKAALSITGGCTAKTDNYTLTGCQQL